MARWQALLVCALLALHASLGVMAQPSAKEIAESHAQALQVYERYVQHLRQVLDMMMRSVEHAKKRSGCILNGGMAHSCDLKDVVSAMDEAKYWSSFLSPGKRRCEVRTKRCVNVGSDECSNEGVPGSGEDDDYFGSENSPGKRSFRIHSKVLNYFPRKCINVWDDGCSNSGLPGSGADDGYFGSGGPGKRGLFLKKKSCLNVGSDECANESVPGAGEDDDYFGSGSPGKRSNLPFQNHPCMQGYRNPLCRALLQLYTARQI